MTAVAAVGVVLGLVLLVGCVVLLVRVRCRLARIEALLAGRPAGLSAEDAAMLVDTAAQRAALAVSRVALPSALTTGGGGADVDDSPRLSETRIKASGWAAGASETVRRLRQGA